MRQRVLLLAAVLASGCGRAAGSSSNDASVPDAVAVPSIPSGKKLVDVTQSRAQCLLSGIRTPPNVRSNHWQDVAELEGGGSHYGWIMLEQSVGEVPELEATHYLSSVPFLLGNVGMNAAGFCTGDWREARANTIMTAVLLVKGSDSRGTFAIFGGTLAGRGRTILGRQGRERKRCARRCRRDGFPRRRNEAADEGCGGAVVRGGQRSVT